MTLHSDYHCSIISQVHGIIIPSSEVSVFFFYFLKYPDKNFPPFGRELFLVVLKIFAPFGRDFHCKINVFGNILLLKEPF